MTPHSDPGKHASGSKSAQAARLLCAAQKVLARFTDLQAMCAGGCRGEPPCPPPAKPTPHNLTALDYAGTPGVFLSFVGTNSGPLSHLLTCPDQAASGRLVKTPPQGLRRFSVPPSAGQKPTQGTPPAVTHNYPLPPARAPSSLCFPGRLNSRPGKHACALGHTPKKDQARGNPTPRARQAQCLRKRKK